ncbi:DNA annealing helicase and endonuclease ZRANB3 isoform X1 [Scleropages formosus]|uniref:Zinc finger RANBP2-type containing 3 n=2 Tax=Scleropages formosus TaxID=113540 RepID=A0A8C9W420_SCLFO|nr:DNA annealing helicase and endonuclease ZRANB3 isoform X1 [Scleropages formosus]
MNKMHRVDPAQQEAEHDDQLSRLPEKLRQRLMPFQKEGVRFALSRNGRCMIADEMGLGKTLQAIAVAYLYKEEWPLLVVVPSSLRYPWIEEMEKWIPELSPEDINLVDSKSDISSIKCCKVTVLGYGLLTSDAHALLDALTQRDFRVILVDESHYLKSRNAARSKILLPLIQKAQRAVLLTGTPALGRPEELFMQINALYPGRFGIWSEYANRYCNAHYRFFGNRRHWDCRGASHLDELHQRLAEVMIRRLKAQVLSQLPQKIRQRIPFDLPKDGAKEAIASFEEWEKLMRTRVNRAEDSENTFAEVMGLVTRMYKQTAIAKAGAVKDYIKMMLENEKLKFLVFAHHLTMLQACTEAVIEAKTRYIRIDGSVPSLERIQLVHQFQSDPETRVAILSIQAAGQGLTLTAATHVVFAELYWNPGHVKQAEDRAHRIGQSCSVHVHYLIARGTFDTVMWAMLNRKETITGSTLNGKKEYLKAEVGDTEKWDFLNFSSAWTPTEVMGSAYEDDQDGGIFFSHFEKDKQQDIRLFFSPSACEEKKRKRQEGDREVKGKQQTPKRRTDQSNVVTPQVKRLRPVIPRVALGRESLSSSGKGGSKSLFTGHMQLSGSAHQRQQWSCQTCTYMNSSLLPYCEMCESPHSSRSTTLSRKKGAQTFSAETSPCATALTPSPQMSSPSTESARHEPEPGSTQNCGTEQQPGPTDHTHVDSTGHTDTPVQLYEGLKFQASRNTDRIYLYTKDGTPLNCNFIPMDIKLENWEDLPEDFNHRENKRHVLNFVREWSSLTAMKQRVVRRSGCLFHRPTLALEELFSSQRRQSITKRYLTREDVAQASLSKAQSKRGTVRVVTKETFFGKSRTTQRADTAPDKSDGCFSSTPPGDPANVQEEAGYLQAVDSTGTPLCLSCQLPCGSGEAWDSRFCQQSCQEEFQVRSSQAYMRARVLEVEHGVCQRCGLQAHQLFQRIRDAPHACRKEILEGTWLAQLPLKQLPYNMVQEELLFLFVCGFVPGKDNWPGGANSSIGAERHDQEPLGGAVLASRSYPTCVPRRWTMLSGQPADPVHCMPQREDSPASQRPQPDEEGNICLHGGL